MKPKIIIVLLLCAVAIAALRFGGNWGRCQVCGNNGPRTTFPVYVEKLQPGSPIQTINLFICTKDRSELTARNPILSCTGGATLGSKVDVVIAFGKPMDWAQSQIKIAGRPETDTAWENTQQDYRKQAR